MQDLDAGGRELTGEIGALYSRITKLEQVSSKSLAHKNADEELDNAWREWEATFDAAKDSIILTDSEFRIVQANLAASRLFDRPLDQIIARTCWQLVHGTDRPPKECPLKRAKTTKKHEEIELYLPQKCIWVADSADPILNEQGGLTGVIHIIRDITDRKQAEQLLRKERDRAQKYLDVAGVMFVAIDAEQRVGLINKKGCEILGYTEDEIIARNWFDNFLPETIREQVREIFEKIVRGELDSLEYYENPILTKNGDQRLIAWHNTVLRDDNGRVVAVLSSGADITERKKAEEAVRKSEHEKTLVLDNASEIIAYHDTNHNILWANRAYQKATGLSLSEMEGKKCYHAWGLDRPCKDCPVTKTIETGEPQGAELTPQNQPHWLPDMGSWLSRAAPVKDKTGSIIGAIEVAYDITERRRAEEALRESEEKYRALVESSPNLVAIYQEGTLKYVNKAMCERLGWTFQEMTSPSFFNPIEKIIPQRFQSLVKENIAKRLRRENISPYEISIKARDGSEIPVIVQAQAILYCGKLADEVIHIDITERKKAEQKLLEDQAKLKSLASQLTLAEEHERRRLATELHDRISQALVISKIKLDALRKSGRSRKLDKALEDVCNSIGQTIQDTRTLTFDLSSPVLYELGFETAVSEWLTDQIQKKHGLAVEFEDDGKYKPLDDDVRILLFRDVRELLINVVKHAGAHKVKVSVRKLDNHICVTVEDDGVGFDPAEVLSMAAKRGEFGLFSIRERLEDLGGHLQIDSAPGRGCKATMTAPLKQKEMTQ